MQTSSSYTDEWVSPDKWVATYGEIVSKSHAAFLINKTPGHITALIKSGELREYRHGVSTRQLAELQFKKRIDAVRNQRKS